MNIDPVEAFWLGVNGLAFLITLLALLDALQVGDLGPGARQLVARGNVRREGFRLLMQLLLLSAIVPGLAVDRPVTLSPPVVALIAVPVVLLLSTIFDAWDRRKLRLMTFLAIKTEQATTLERIEAAVAEVGVKADMAYQEANTVNQKIDKRTEAIARGEAVTDGPEVH